MTFAGIIEALGGGKVFGPSIGITPGYARVLKSRDWIPPIYWSPTIDAAKSRRVKGVSFKRLRKLAAAKNRGGAGAVR